MGQQDRTPEAILREVIAALERSDWRAVFPLMDPSDLPKWRRNILLGFSHMDAQSAHAILAEWGVNAVEELERCSDDELFGRWLSASSPEAKRRVATSGRGAPAGPRLRRQVIGPVKEGEALVHVVYRESWEDSGRPGILRIATVRMTPVGWRLALDYGLLGNADWHVAPAPPPP